MSSLFYGCHKSKQIPDISEWNTSNVNEMSSLFYGCHKLKEIPDISKWNTCK